MTDERDRMLLLLRAVLAAVDGTSAERSVNRDVALGVEIRHEIAPRIRDLLDQRAESPNPGSAALWARRIIEVMREHPEYARDAYDEVAKLLREARDTIEDLILSTEVSPVDDRMRGPRKTLSALDELLSKLSEP